MRERAGFEMEREAQPTSRRRRWSGEATTDGGEIGHGGREGGATTDGDTGLRREARWRLRV